MNLSLLVLILGIAISSMSLRSSDKSTSTQREVSWPATYEGHTLTPLTLTERESAFSKSFPGSIAVFESSAGQQIIFRQVTKATRQLHDSATCLRASGYTITNRLETKDGQTLNIREHIESLTQTWTDISAWFWHAHFHPNDAPWRAVTIFEK
jgi:hypothetical protein